MRTKAENEREAGRIELRLRAAKAEARNLAMRIGEDPQVLRILLFGSVATGRGFRLGSDIDIAVEGGDVLSHRALAERSAFPVDIVDLFALPDLLKAGLESEGQLLYEKHS